MDFAGFREALARGEAVLLHRERVADLDTPVGAFLKLADGKPFSFLLESVEGGAARGRYSAIGLAPDLIWRVRDGVAECNTQALAAPHAFEPEALPPLDALRARIRAVRMPRATGLPSIAAGLFGYLGYDMVRQMERLPATNPDVLGIPEAVLIRPTNPDVLGIPEAVLIRPTLVAVFDHVRDALTLVTPVWSAEDPEAAWAQAQARLDDAEAALAGPLPRPAPPARL
ncbi:MAG TPA: anthranilate synthase component I, partial [Roseococcus sp.]|nr:anthranilate synthase component I [Roseococcus sp.]